jgi:uncharacterized membrane-anchored protein YhcB (DUF1043 family)
MHDAITIGIPVIAILLGILFNRNDVRRLEDKMDQKFEKVHAEIRDLRAEMNSRFNAIEAELRYFHGVTGKLDGRIQAI